MVVNDSYRRLLKLTVLDVSQTLIEEPLRRISVKICSFNDKVSLKNYATFTTSFFAGELARNRKIRQNGQ